MLILEYLKAEPLLFTIVAVIFGLMIGSFLNVVIFRLPKMLQTEWQQQCQEYLELQSDSAETDEKYNLITPASTCPHCGHKIKPWENIPVISYLFLRGRCAECKQGISVRYPIIELITGLLSGFVAWHFGYGTQGLAAILLTWILITLSMIDYDTKLLPDIITLPVLWLGLLLNLDGLFVSLEDSVLGAVIGYMSLWSIYQVHHKITGREGMGFGDFKLLALLGAWFGWQSLLLIVLLSSVVGAIVGISLIMIMGRDKLLPIPFGPYLAAAGWISMIWGEQIMRAYLGISGIH